MKLSLEQFVKDARDCGCGRYLVRTPGGDDLAKGVWGEHAADDASRLEAMATDDALPRDREKTHEYPVVATSEDGVKSARFTIRVRGGATLEGGHTVDEQRSQSAGAVIGHLTRLVVELAKVLRDTNAANVEQAKVFRQEWEKTARASLKQGRYGVELELVRQQAETDRAEREQSNATKTKLLGDAVSFGLPLLARFLGPAGASTGLDAFKKSLSDEQHEKLEAIAGAPFARKLLVASSPEEVFAVLDRLSEEQQAALAMMLTPEQQRMLGSVLADEGRRREQEKAKANGAAHTEAGESSAG